MRDDGRKTGFNKRKDTVLGTIDKRREREREKTSEGVERGRMYAARRGCEGEREKD